jgi:hypothetical protein
MSVRYRYATYEEERKKEEKLNRSCVQCEASVKFRYKPA